MKIVGKPPAWAMKIVREQARHHRRKLPDITWQFTRKTHGTAGSCQIEENKLFIRQGRSYQNAKLTWLHELAHWLTGDNHSHTFWLKAWELYRRYRIPIGYALREEAHYRQGALAAYWEGRDRRGRRPTARVTIKTNIVATPPKEARR
jgi:hypothetical protein